MTLLQVTVQICTWVQFFGNPEDIYVCGQFISGRIALNKKFLYDFIILKWDTIVLSLIDLDLPMPTTLQISNWQKSKIKRMFDSSNSYFRIVAHNPNTLKVESNHWSIQLT